mmetsp:Transcript_21192/g.23989  ORF Transcript_21192/g.23989 Transcript_21192/m.23989 type:complete len:90 (+) Transcript_21192:60-329(+)|eukprot:CAMPEP_0115013914 /NCGR_PEP_ID=MMETSP0216-20121206/25723_1 /TAXON_ID=223996 /ORGANISM="Protocruzia adherens, Strain Boccale" /LENGTH=89 /DNA_ID=CAMNT_0002383467 /DNA_START=48 /DNA_END=317 /DNA_ORIENTATION=+
MAHCGVYQVVVKGVWHMPKPESPKLGSTKTPPHLIEAVAKDPLVKKPHFQTIESMHLEKSEVLSPYHTHPHHNLHKSPKSALSMFMIQP